MGPHIISHHSWQYAGVTKWRHRCSIQIAIRLIVSTRFVLFIWLLVSFLVQTLLAMLLILCVILCIDYQCVPKPIGRRQYWQRESKRARHKVRKKHANEINTLNTMRSIFFVMRRLLSNSSVYFWCIRIWQLENFVARFFIGRLARRSWLLLEFSLQCLFIYWKE